jgi:hypothetical protein
MGVAGRVPISPKHHAREGALHRETSRFNQGAQISLLVRNIDKRGPADGAESPGQ